MITHHVLLRPNLLMQRKNPADLEKAGFPSVTPAGFSRDVVASFATSAAEAPPPPLSLVAPPPPPQKIPRARRHSGPLSLYRPISHLYYRIADFTGLRPFVSRIWRIFGMFLGFAHAGGEC